MADEILEERVAIKRQVVTSSQAVGKMEIEEVLKGIIEAESKAWMVLRALEMTVEKGRDLTVV